MAIQTSRLHGLFANSHLFFIDKIFGCQATVQIGRQRQSVFVADNAGIGFNGMRMGVNQTQNAPRQPIVHLMGSFNHHLLIGVYQ